MSVNNYVLGSVVTLTGKFYSDAALTIPADPTTVTLSILAPDGSTSTPSPVHGVTGVWTYAFTPTLRGMHEARWTGVGTIVSASEEFFLVLPDLNTGVDLCTVADVQLRFSTKDNPAGIIQQAITAASLKIFARYNREFTPLTAGATRTFRLNSNVLVFPSQDLRAVNGAGVVLDPAGTPVTLSATTDYRLTPRGLSDIGTYTGITLSQFVPLVSGTTLGFGFAELSITGDWGAYSTATVPGDIRDAAVETVGSWLDRAVSVYAGSAGIDPDDYQASPDRFAGYAIPPTAHAALSQYDRLTLR